MTNHASHSGLDPRPRRRGSVVFIVIWTLAIAAIAAAASQLLSFRQATLGRVAVERVQARWAARSGLEYTIQMMANHTEHPIPDDKFAMVRDMEAVYAGSFDDAGWRISHSIEGEEWPGPKDEHSKLNLNAPEMTGPMLLLLDDMTYDVADAILDWLDDDDDPGTLGVENDYYESLSPAYSPRNGAMRSIAELELVAGIWPELLRGEDWNMNGRLEANENDGPLSLPLDEPDGVLDAGWSEYLTVYSVDGGATASGLPRIWLRAAEPETIVEQVGITDAQARSLIYFGRNPENRLETLNTVALNRVDASGNISSRVTNPTADTLTAEEIIWVQEECSMTDPLDRLPGKLNINTIPQLFLRDLLSSMEADDYVIDEILYRRDSGPEGIVSIYDLRDIPQLPAAVWESLQTMFTTNSNVYTVSSRGRGAASGLEVEIIAVVDRSTLPVKIIEYREQ